MSEKKDANASFFYLSFTALYARPAALAKNLCALAKARGQTDKEYPNASKDPLPCHRGASGAGPAVGCPSLAKVRQKDIMAWLKAWSSGVKGRAIAARLPKW